MPPMSVVAEGAAIDGRMDPDLRDALALLPRGPRGLFDLTDLERARRELDVLVEGMATPPDPAVAVETAEVPRPSQPAVPLRLFRPAAPSGPMPALLWFHGGGQILGFAAQEDAYLSRLSRSVGCVVVAVDYRLAPEAPPPAAADDGVAAYLWLRDGAGALAIDPGRIGLAGASGGGCIAAAVALMLRDQGRPTPLFQSLIYPMLDDRNATRSSTEITDVGIWDRHTNLLAWQIILGDAAGGPDVPAYAAPARASDLAGLPPTFVAVAELDVFRDEDTDYAARLAAAGVPTELHAYPGAYHAFDVFAPDADVSKRFQEAWCGFITRQLHAAASRSPDATNGGSHDMDTVEPFHLAVPEAELDDLRERLTRTRWPDRETVDDASQGPPLEKVQALCSYWLHDYDWRRCESMLNDFGQYTTDIDGLRIHFLHVRSPEPNAFPLLLAHGWPGSVLEFHRVVGPLTDPAAHGGDAADAFDLVIPSMPGYGYSGKPEAPGWNIARIAAAWGTLMQRLGYERWGVQGGDWGALVAEQIGREELAGCVGLHLNFTLVAPTPEELADPSPTEQRVIEDFTRFYEEQSSYLKMQTTSPQTLGYSLCDSPSGLAAWIYAMFQDFTDNDGGPESVLSLDTMLDQIMMFWLTNTSASSIRLNWEAARERAAAEPATARIAVPAGFSMFPKEVLRTSRRWAEARFSDVIHFNELDEGGHFAALEQPDVFVNELRQTFQSLHLDGERDG